jgi:hypothetical protein
LVDSNLFHGSRAAFSDKHTAASGEVQRVKSTNRNVKSTVKIENSSGFEPVSALPPSPQLAQQSAVSTPIPIALPNSQPFTGFIPTSTTSSGTLSAATPVSADTVDLLRLSAQSTLPPTLSGLLAAAAAAISSGIPIPPSLFPYVFPFQNPTSSVVRTGLTDASRSFNFGSVQSYPLLPSSLLPPASVLVPALIPAVVPVPTSASVQLQRHRL